MDKIRDVYYKVVDYAREHPKLTACVLCFIAGAVVVGLLK